MQQTNEQAVQTARQDQQNENLALYNKVRSVPEHALKKIEAGPNENMTDEELETIAPWSEAARAACGKTQE